MQSVQIARAKREACCRVITLHANGVSITSNLSDVINVAAREQAFPMQVVVLREIEGEMKEISLLVTPL